SYPVSFNASFFIDISVNFGSPWYIVEAPAEGLRVTSLDGYANQHGLAIYYLYISDFNTSEYLMPTIFRARNVIDNVTYSVQYDAGLNDIDVSFYVGRSSSGLLEEVTLFYDDGSGETSVSMVKGWNTYDVSMGSFENGSTITFHVTVETTYGDVFELSEQVINLPGGEPTTTTTTTTSSTGPTTSPTQPGGPINPMLLAVVGGIGVVVVVIIVIALKKKGT
ncbi:MAG: hypothetical protein ACFFE1_14230, partial [Candidatus Thorarchaeota archaeon]